MNVKPFVLDCDTGRDDALTLWICNRLGLPLVAVMSSYGNVSLDQVCINNTQALALAGDVHIPVFKGQSKPVREHSAYLDVVLKRQQTVGNGLSDIVLPETLKKAEDADFVEWLKAYVREHGKLDYVMIGPPTNLAILIESLGGEFSNHINQVTMMGGKFSPLWEELPGADFNILADPYALDSILSAGVEVNFVPMNETYPVALHLDEIKDRTPRDEVSRFAKDIMLSHVEHFAPEPFFRFHDPLVPFAMMEKEKFKPMQVVVNLDEKSRDFGRLIEDVKGSSIKVLSLNETERSDILNSILNIFFEQ